MTRIEDLRRAVAEATAPDTHDPGALAVLGEQARTEAHRPITMIMDLGAHATASAAAMSDSAPTTDLLCHIGLHAPRDAIPAPRLIAGIPPPAALLHSTPSVQRLAGAGLSPKGK